MEKKEIITGLKAGKALMLDGWATPEERKIISNLDKKGKINMQFLEGDQYGAWRITWKPQQQKDKTL